MKKIKYIIEITCELKGGVVIPIGCDNHIEDESSDHANTLLYPKVKDIMNIWIGKSLEYPQHNIYI